MSAQKNTEKQKDGRSGPGGIVFSLVAIVLAAAGGWYWSTRRVEPVATSTSGQVKSTLHLETFVLNLAGPDQRSYLRVGIDLGLGREPGKDENARTIAPVRDTILNVLAEARVEDLVDEKGKTKLKAELLHALQERLPGLEVEEVYYTEFLIQR